MFKPEVMAATILLALSTALDQDIHLTGAELHHVCFDLDQAHREDTGVSLTGETYVEGPDGPVGIHIQDTLGALLCVTELLGALKEEAQND